MLSHLLTMILSKEFIRKNTRRIIVNSVGSISKVAPGIHILAGHYMSRNHISDNDSFLRLLNGLNKQARFIRIEDACSMIDQKERVDEPLVAFTFDDGFRDCITHIAPALEMYGTNAAFFVNPGFSLANEANAEAFSRNTLGVPEKKPLNRNEIKSLAESGFIIGAHTIDHVDLRSKDPVFLERQIVDCKTLVEDLSGCPCRWFAWTYGGYKHISDVALNMALKHYDRVFSSDDHRNYTGPNSRILNRRHFEPFWDLSEVKFFLRKERVYPI